MDNFIGALSDFLEAKKFSPNDPELDYNCGSAYLGLHEYEKALQYFEGLINRWHVNALILNDQANALHECGKTQDALASYDQAITLDPYYPDAHYNKALLLQSENRLEEACVELQKTVDIDPCNKQAMNNLGIIHEKIYDFPSALEVLKRAVEIDPDYVEAHANLGNIYSSLKQMDLAIQCYDKAISLKKGLSQLYNNRANALGELDRCWKRHWRIMRPL